MHTFFKNQLLNEHSEADLSLDLMNILFVIGSLYSTFFPITSKDMLPSDVRSNAMIREMAKQMSIYAPIQVFVSKKNLEITDQAGGVYVPWLWNSLQVRLSADEQRLNFVIRHELAHLKNQDFLFKNIYTVVMIELLTTAIQRISLIHSLPLVLFSFMSLFYLLRYQEKRADLIAASFSSPKEIQEMVDLLEVNRSKHLSLRNTNNLFIDLLMRLFVDNQGNILFACSPLIFDTHPPFTERIKYLRPFVTCNSSASCSLKAFIKQTENQNFENINLSSEEILDIQREIDKSSKRDRYQRLEKIEILPYLDYANVRLFFSGERPYFIPFDFESSLLSGNVSCVIEILRVILNQPSKNFYHKSIREHMPIPSTEALREEYFGVTQRCVFMVKDQHTKNSMYVIYPEEKPLSLEYHQLANYCV